MRRAMAFAEGAGALKRRNAVDMPGSGAAEAL